MCKVPLIYFWLAIGLLIKLGTHLYRGMGLQKHYVLMCSYENIHVNVPLLLTSVQIQKFAFYMNVIYRRGKNKTRHRRKSAPNHDFYASTYFTVGPKK